VRHELRKRILKRFQAEGIEMPFPTRTVHLRNIPPHVE
jgi:small-conductance mechanosensitive channel